MREEIMMLMLMVVQEPVVEARGGKKVKVEKEV